MTTNFRFDPVELPPEAKELRQEVRAFLRQEEEAGTFSPHSGKGSFSREFSRKMGARGWIGMTWPKKYGGHERSQLERYVVTEEMLAAHAPTRAHSTADRQSGPVILRYGQEEIRQKILPQHCRRRIVLLHRPQRAEFGLRRVRRLDPRDQDRWRLAGQWAQDLDLERARSRLHDRAAAHFALDQGKPPARADPVPG